MLEAGGAALGRVDAVIDAAVAEKRLVGVVVLIAYDGKIVLIGAPRDWRTARRGRQMSAERIFRWSSLTKPIVSAAAMALVERGKLGLDDAVTRWLPDFRPKLPDGRTPRHHGEATPDPYIRPGLRVRRGTPMGPTTSAQISDGLDESTVSLEKNLRRLASVPLLFEPGKSWNYSLGIDVIGARARTCRRCPARRCSEPTGHRAPRDERHGVLLPRARAPRGSLCERSARARSSCQILQS